MATPRTRRTATKEKPEIIKTEEGDIVVEVNETIDSDGKSTKDLSYATTLKDVKNDNANSQSSSEEPEDNFTDFEDFDEREVEEIPKDKLDLMFDLIEAELKDVNEVCYAKITRQPDGLTDVFNVPCTNQMPLGVFSFSLARDKFNFIPKIQEKNNNSGGIVNILIYNKDQEAVSIFSHYEERRPIYRQIGARNLLIPNPIITETQNNNNNLNHNVQSDREFYAEQQRKSDERLATILAAFNKPKEQSVLERALEAKMIQDITNPPTPQNSFEDMLKTVVAAPVFAEKLTSKMFPDNPTQPTEKKWYENVLESEGFRDKVLDIFGNVVDRATSMIETKTFANLSPEQQAKVAAQNAVMYEDDIEPETPQTPPLELTPEQQKTNDNMKELVSKIITELESENVIDSNNALVKELSSTYENEFAMLKLACASMSFNDLLSRIAGSVPETIKPYLDSAFTDGQGNIIAVLNEQTGEKELMFTDLRMKGRLLELYNFLKT